MNAAIDDRRGENALGIFSTTLIWQFAATALTTVLPVVLETNSGESIQGNFVGAGATSIQIEIDGNTRSISLDDLSVLKPATVPSGIGPKSPSVTLVNGSHIAAEEVSLSDNEVTIQPRRQPPLRTSVKAVKAIRFRPPSAAIDSKWLGSSPAKAVATHWSSVVETTESIRRPA